MTEMQGILDQLVSTRAQMSLENILNMKGEEQNCRIINDETLVESVLVDNGVTDQERHEKAEPCELPPVLPVTRKDLLKALSIG